MPFVPPTIPGAQGYPLGLTGATAATRYVGGTTSSSPASGTFAVGDYVIGEDGTVYICTVAGSPGTWTQVGSGGGTALLGLKSYAPAATTIDIATSTLTAFDTTNITVSFTAPASGIVLVRATCCLVCSNGTDKANLCLFTHSTTTVVGTVYSFQPGTEGSGFWVPTTAVWRISGLTPSASLQYDLAGGNSAATVRMELGNSTVATAVRQSPATLEVWSAS